MNVVLFSNGIQTVGHYCWNVLCCRTLRKIDMCVLRRISHPLEVNALINKTMETFLFFNLVSDVMLKRK